MSIDWTQTLLGSHAFHDADAEATDGEGLPPVLGVEAYASVRLGAAMAATFLLVGLIALVPARGMALSLSDALAACGVLAVQVLALALALRWGRPGLGIAAFSPLLALPFFLASGLPQGLAAAALVIACSDTGLVRLRLDGVARRVHGVVALAAAAATLGLVAALDFPGWAAFSALVVLALPVVVLSARVIGAPEVAATPQGDGRAVATLEALLARDGAEALLVDAAGTIYDTFPRKTGWVPQGHAVTDRILIADRILALHAVSHAVHDHRRTDGLMLRMRVDEGAPLAPPQFVSRVVSVQPAPGLFGRAILIVEKPSTLAPSAAAAPSSQPQVDAALFARALHDATSPFNAGLGFLEMLADPRLAPHDLATFRGYAAEAHKAVAEAHRNSALMARWLKLTLTRSEAGLQATEGSAGQMVQDALRAIGFGDPGSEHGLSFKCEAALPPVLVPQEAARFAVQVLVRGALARLPAEQLLMRVTRDGDALVVLALPKAAGGYPESATEPLQRVLQDAAASFLPVRFQAGAGGVLSLVFEGIFARSQGGDGEAKADAGASPEPDGHRLAS